MRSHVAGVLVLAVGLIAGLCHTQPIKLKKLEWWQDTIFYQIYPRSFKDSGTDGIGDIKGITEKLPYLKETGITATWLSPIFKSPMFDFGYDISDFRDIQGEYGTLEDFDGLIATARSLGIYIILDFVPNHSSDQHEWFQKSVRKELGYENYYVWHPGKVDQNGKRQPPNNWVSVFRGSGWTWNEQRQEYFFHQFLKEQPDLNFREPRVIEEMKEVLRFWLNKGVSGFRVDAVPHLVESSEFLDEPLSGNPGQNEDDYGYLIHNYTTNLPETFDIVRGWREVLDDWSKSHDGISKVMMLEVYGSSEISLKYYKSGASFSFNFQLLDLDQNSSAQQYAKVINTWLTEVPQDVYTPNWVLGNHDKPRMATRLNVQRVDGLNMMLQTLPGIAVTYNGEELGMENGHVTWEQHQDTACHEDDFENCRDFARTPFPWDTSPNAGFTSGNSPWLPVDDAYKTVNAQTERKAKESHYHVYNKMTQMRKAMSFRYGTTTVNSKGNVLYILRHLQGYDPYLLVFNLGEKDASIDLKDLNTEGTIVVRSVKATHQLNAKINLTEPFNLKGYEAYLIRLRVGF